ncbi:peptidoglycan DD-metalloendopeptidase family protein [Paenibacillus sp. 1A_MP2]|uniref:peptidoglycan DD-metalloendopeptidase family protein n=1 Tax=Paenibacillus sp. 1A_MP2 TaxID=3457495 RepID=UPI003FCEA506
MSVNNMLKQKVKKRLIISGLGSIGTVVLVVVGGFLLLMILAGGIGAAVNSLVPDWFNKGIEAPGLSEIGVNEVPAQYIPIYQRAAEAYNVPWTLLAAVHRVETVFSTDKRMISSVGAIGHMQFMPRTWIGWSYPGTRLGDADIPDDVLTDPAQIAHYGGYGTDANGDGKADPWDIEDAIFTAAKYLSANGGSPFDMQKALYAYNKSNEYYLEVTGFVDLYTDGGYELVMGDVESPGSTHVGVGGSLPYQEISREWMDGIGWSLDGANKIGLNAELKKQVEERGIGIPHAMIYVLVMTKDQRNNEKSAREFAAALAPRDMEVIQVEKTITTKKTNKDGKTSTSVKKEKLLFIQSIRTYKGVYRYQVGYQENEETSDSGNGGSTTIITKNPILAKTDLEEDDSIVKGALKTAHLTGKQAMEDFYVLVKLVDPTFSDSNLPLDQEIIIGENGSYATGQLQWVVPGFYTLSSLFGSRTDPVTGAKGAMHNGMDIPAPIGTPVVAADNGVVESAVQNHAKAGNFVVINHGNGMKTRYLHMNKLLVRQGQMVKRGQVIGQVGNTGKSTGPHMHTEVLLNDTAVDPLPYYRTQKGGPADD